MQGSTQQSTGHYYAVAAPVLEGANHPASSSFDVASLLLLPVPMLGSTSKYREYEYVTPGGKLGGGSSGR